MTNKKCFKCGETKALSEFYKHPMMGDGHLGKCKECTKVDVRENRKRRRKQYQEYERKRFKSSNRRQAVLRYSRESRRRDPMKASARRRTAYAIRNGFLIRKPCSVCGNKKSQAHHEDYSRPLDVVWLCFKHHRERHGQIVE